MKRAKRILSLLLSLCLVLGLCPSTAFAASGNLPFTDVNTADWYYNAVQYAYEKGMMNGTSTTTFSPNDTTTRGMIVTILHRMEGTPVAVGTAFTDVPSGQWYSDAVSWASANGIVDGYGGGMFGPSDLITREQMAAILNRYSQHKGYDTGASGSIAGFSDASQVSSYAVDPMGWAIGNGLISGVGNNTLAPKGNATRAQVATILTRFSENIANKSVNKTYTVTFDLNYGSDTQYDVKTVKEGETVSKPANPSRSGFSFSGWYAEKSGGKQFDFKTGITSDLTLYAHWSSNSSSSSGGGGYVPPSATYYTVTFDLNYNDAGVYQTQQVAKGGTVADPGSPSRIGYDFTGWYTDSGAKLPFDFTTSVTSNITLYAGWYQTVDNLEDDEIDRGDIEDMLTAGDIDVIFDENGNIRTIDGKFTDKKVETNADAADVLNSATALFSDGRYFYVDVAEIEGQSAVDNELAEEHFFRYSPTINGIPVLGSQIILSTNEKGDVSGLFSSYNDAINTVNTSADVTSKNAESMAVDQLLQLETLEDYFNGLAESNADYSKDDYINELRESILAETELVIYAADGTDAPVLVYSVRLNNSYLMADDTTSDEIPEDDGRVADEVISVGSDTEDSSEKMGTPIPYIDLTYYIYANGSQAGNVYRVIDHTEGVASSYLITANDLKNQARTFQAIGENGTYWLRDTSRNLETYKTTFGGFLWTQPQLPGELVKFKNSINKTAVSAHANMAAVYDFYKNILGRTSFDGYGAKIKVSYDYDDIDLIFTNNYYNAFWSASLQQMVFGDDGNLAAALDVAGHEFTHAVINYVVGDGSATHSLTYYGESGALNEAYTDILGNLIEGKTGSDSGRWLLGEDSDSAIRSMASPSSYSQPEHYNNRYTGTSDNGGVHTNSGIFNFAAYKMMTDRRTIGITQETWAKVFYRSLYRLTEDATFLDARGAIIATAKTLGFTADEQQAIKDAFDAVGITEPDSIRIVLTWGATPSDLDSHLVGPGISGGERFHIAYYQRTYYADGTYYSNSSRYVADLDYDDTSSYGPEVTTIHILTPGEYYFFVHDFSNGSSEASTEMVNSDAKVKVYKGSSSTPISTFSVDPSSSGTYWDVFKLTIGANGSITIDTINTYGAVETLS